MSIWSRLDSLEYWKETHSASLREIRQALGIYGGEHSMRMERLERLVAVLLEEKLGRPKKPFDLDDFLRWTEQVMVNKDA